MLKKAAFFFFLLSQILLAQEECTIGVAAGKATSDGRPLVWKTRDNSSERDNELVYNTSYSIPFLEIINAGKTYAWMGLNRSGFAIVNTVCSDLPVTGTGLSNGSLMRNALGVCSTIAEFETFLEQNDHGNTRGNFGLIDSGGGAAIFEISGSEYWKFDANDSTQAANAFLIRTNFAINGNGTDGSGYERFKRSSDLIDVFSTGDSLNYKSILRYQMRDFSDYDSDPVAVPYPDKWYSYRPYGYIYTNVSINRWSSVSATVIQGVLTGESALLSTMWTMLGSPAASVAVPYWPVGATPEKADGSSSAPLCDISLNIRSELFDYTDSKYYIDSYKLLDGEGGGLWCDLFPVEDSVFVAGETWLNKWRTNGVNISEMLTVEQTYAEYAYVTLQQAYTKLVTDIPDLKPDVLEGFRLYQNYPNPFNPVTTVRYRLPSKSKVDLTVYNVSGQKVTTLINGEQRAGIYTHKWNAGKLSSGIYFCRLKAQTADNEFTDFIKLNYIK